MRNSIWATILLTVCVAGCHAHAPFSGTRRMPVRRSEPAEVPAAEYRTPGQAETAATGTPDAQQASLASGSLPGAASPEVAPSPPTPPGPGPSTPAAAESEVSLAAVVRSVETHYPLLRSAMLARVVAAGRQQSARGPYDLDLGATSFAEPLSYYEYYTQELRLKQLTPWGGRVFGGYRLGRGEVPPWYQELVTNQGGEFKVGAVLPLLRNRDIDYYRTDVWLADLERNRVEPAIRAELLLFTRDAAMAYWDWVAAGQNYRIARALLENAQFRARAIREQVDRGERAAIDIAENELLLATRNAKLIASEQKVAQAAIKLSLFLRDEAGQPRIAAPGSLPADFPPTTPEAEQATDQEIQTAFHRRPELQELAVQRRQLEVQLRQSQNLALPNLDLEVNGSQDVGAKASPKGDKSPYESEAIVTMSVPMQRREATGKMREVKGKLAQLGAKRQFTADKIAAEVRAARTALAAAYKQILQAQRAVRLARQMEKAEQDLYALGNSTLLQVNLREQQTAVSREVLIAAMQDYFQSLAAYEAAMGCPGEPTAGQRKS